MDPEFKFPEVIITSGRDSCQIFNADNSSVLKTYNEAEIAPKTLCLIADSYLIGAHATKPMIRVWLINKKKQDSLGIFHCRGLVKALAVSPCGEYCVGAIKEEIHIWQVHTGELLSVISRHYQEVTCVKFSSDSSLIFSGGKDGVVLAFDLGVAISIGNSGDNLSQPEPQYVWHDHAGEITDIYPGILGVWARVATTSEDRTCRLYELESGVLLSTITLNAPIFSVVMDIAEHFLFLGTTGSIYKISLYEKLPAERHIEDDEEVKFEITKSNIISLSLSFDGTRILSSAANGDCKVFDVDTMQLCLAISHKDTITNSFFAPTPEPVLNPEWVPPFPVTTFQREFDTSAKRGVRKFEKCVSLCAKPLTLFKKECENELYSTDVQNGFAFRQESDSSDPKLKSPDYEEKPLDILTNVNAQMYTYFLNRSFDKKE